MPEDPPRPIDTLVAPRLDWAVDVDYAADGQERHQTLALRACGPDAADRDAVFLRARNRRWLASHGIEARTVTGLRVRMIDKEINP